MMVVNSSDEDDSDTEYSEDVKDRDDSEDDDDDDEYTSDKMDILRALPPEVCEKILSYLGPEDLARASMVSKVWRSVGNVNHLWRQFCEDEMPFQTDFIKRREVSVTSEDELEERCEWAQVYSQHRTRLLSHWLLNNPEKTTFPISSRGALATDGRVLAIATPDQMVHIYDIRVPGEPGWLQSIGLPADGEVNQVFISKDWLIARQGGIISVARKDRGPTYSLEYTICINMGELVTDCTVPDAPIMDIFLLANSILVSAQDSTFMWSLDSACRSWVHPARYRYFNSDGDLLYFMSAHEAAVVDQNGYFLLTLSQYYPLFLYGNPRFIVGMNVYHDKYMLDVWHRPDKTRTRKIVSWQTSRPYGWMMHPSDDLMAMVTCPSITSATVIILTFNPFTMSSSVLPLEDLAHADLCFITSSLLAILHRANWDLLNRHLSLVHIPSGLLLYSFDITSQYLLYFSPSGVLYKQDSNSLKILNYR